MLLVANFAITKWSKKPENDWNPSKWVFIWECSVRAIQWIPAWQDLDGFQKTFRPCALDKNSLSFGRVNLRTHGVYTCYFVCQDILITKQYAENIFERGFLFLQLWTIPLKIFSNRNSTLTNRCSELCSRIYLHSRWKWVYHFVNLFVPGVRLQYCRLPRISALPSCKRRFVFTNFLRSKTTEAKTLAWPYI